ncbi:site-2 protease family protein [Streptomyces marokkonensis]|uniref:site-2 protease family protein n=1 Tax=Streptomyces marokkonensis TaxID=324855 RepID=UPI0011F10DE4|nr:site-2 protease family protein [Streptomyces marokkonensis]
MDVSGGRGQPRPGNDESADHTGPEAPAAGDALPGTGARPVTPAGPTDDGARTPGPASPPAAPDDTAPDADTPADRGAEPGQPSDRTEPGAGRRGTEGPAPADRGAEPGQPSDRTEPGAGRRGTEGPAPADQDPEPGQPSDRKAPAGPHHASGAGPAPGAWTTPPAGQGTGGHPADDPAARHGGDRPLAHSGGGRGPGPRRPEERQRGGLLMGRPFGVPVYVAPSWFLVAILITWVFGGQIDRVLPELGAASYLVSLFFAVAFYASVLVHELAHTLAALRFKLPVRRIQLQFFGGVSEIEKEAETPGREFVLAFVGPLLSLVLSGLFYLALLAVDPSSVPGVLLAGLMISNLIVAVFNLLPGLPLDGGRMLRAVVWAITGKPMTGTIAAAWVGRALAVSVLIGLPLLTQSGALGSDAVDNVGMDTVLDALLAAILAAIIWTGAGNSLRMARLREHLPELRARTLTRRAVPVESDTPLSEALRRANAAGARALVVVDPDGAPLSLVREAAIVGVPEHRRPWVPVSGLAQDLTDGMRVSAELAGEDLLDALRAAPATEYLVVEETGEIYGVLSAADVERAFVKAMARPS